MRIKKIMVWDDSQNRGYEHAVIEIRGQSFPENDQDIYFAIKRPGYAEPYLINQPKDDESPWSGAESERTRLEPEYSELSNGKLRLMVGPSIVRHMSRGNYELKLIDIGGGGTTQKKFNWVVQTPLAIPRSPGTAVPPPAPPEPVRVEQPTAAAPVEPPPEPDEQPPSPAPEDPIEPEAPPEPPPPREPKKRSKAIWIVPVVLLVAALAGYLVIGKDKSPNGGGKGPVATTTAPEKDNNSTQAPPPPAPSLSTEEIRDRCRTGSMPVDQCYQSAQRFITKVKENPDQDLLAVSLELLEVSGQQGNGEANALLGRTYDPSIDLTSDRRTQRDPKPSLAYDYYRKSVEQGTVNTCKDLTRLRSWVQQKSSADEMMALMLRTKKWELPNCRR